MLSIVIIVLLVVAAWVASLYAQPFGACPRCDGGRIVILGSGPKLRATTCPRCKGAGRRQRPASRTIHQLSRRVRRELDRQRKQRATALTGPKE